MTKGELVNAVADRSGLSRADAARAVASTFGVITDALRDGTEVKVVGFGSFVVGHRPAGQGRNPRTGDTVQVAASRLPRFRAGAQRRAPIWTVSSSSSSWNSRPSR